MLSILAAAVFVMVSSAERWVPIGNVANADSGFLDVESIKRDGRTITVWTRRDAAKPLTTRWQEWQIDCAAKTSVILAWVQDEAGSVTHNVDRPYRASAPIVPGSIEADIFKLVCF